MYDFLTFKTFITPTILIFIYYIGAMVIPLILYLNKKRLSNRLNINIKLHWKLQIVLAVIFLMLETMWRMGFEMLIGYFQIHNALVK